MSMDAPVSVGLCLALWGARQDLDEWKATKGVHWGLVERRKAEWKAEWKAE